MEIQPFEAAHKTLNVPCDCGIAIVADPATLRSTFGTHADYLIADTSGPGDPIEKMPEFSRRARGVPVWAALRSLGRSGVANLLEGLVAMRRRWRRGWPASPEPQVVNDVVYTQAAPDAATAGRSRGIHKPARSCSPASSSLPRRRGRRRCSAR